MSGGEAAVLIPYRRLSHRWTTTWTTTDRCPLGQPTNRSTPEMDHADQWQGRAASAAVLDGVGCFGAVL